MPYATCHELLNVMIGLPRTADVLYPRAILTSSRARCIIAAAIDRATSCQVGGGSSAVDRDSIPSTVSAFKFSKAVSSSFLSSRLSGDWGSNGITFPKSPHEMGGGEDSGVSTPAGALAGTCARYGYRWRRISRTAFVKSINISSIDAFSAENQRVFQTKLDDESYRLHTQVNVP